MATHTEHAQDGQPMTSQTASRAGPLALMGLGAGWLMLTLRNQRHAQKVEQHPLAAGAVAVAAGMGMALLLERPVQQQKESNAATGLHPAEQETDGGTSQAKDASTTIAHSDEEP